MVLQMVLKKKCDVLGQETNNFFYGHPFAVGF